MTTSRLLKVVFLRVGIVLQSSYNYTSIDSTQKSGLNRVSHREVLVYSQSDHTKQYEY